MTQVGHSPVESTAAICSRNTGAENFSFVSIKSMGICSSSWLSRVDGLCDFAVLEAWRDKLDDALLAFVQDPFSVAVFPIHGCSRRSILGTEGGKALFNFLPPDLPLVVSSSIVVGWSVHS
jgi:hypothetical protein